MIGVIERECTKMFRNDDFCNQIILFFIAFPTRFFKICISQIHKG